MFGTFKKVVRKAFLTAGVDIRRTGPSPLVWLRTQNIGTVFDIGANTGEFAALVHTLLPEATIYSFEPLKECYTRLVSKMKAVPGFRAFDFALGDRECESEMHRSKFSPSSSILSMAKLHKELFPFTEEEGTEKIRVRRLDDVAMELYCPENILVKIDVQGYEDKVILGGKELISRAKILIVEISFQTLYEGQPLFDEIYDMLRTMWFVYAGSVEQIKSPIDGSVLQSDSIFLKRAPSEEPR
jgi:FkbM family methyltransferase